MSMRNGIITVIAICGLAILIFVWPRYGYGEGGAYFQGSDATQENQKKDIDPFLHMSELSELLRSHGYVQTSADRIAMPVVPVLASGTSGFLEAQYEKRCFTGNSLIPKVYSTTEGDKHIIGIRTKYTSPTIFECFYFQHEQDALRKQVMALRGKLLKHIMQIASNEDRLPAVINKSFDGRYEIRPFVLKDSEIANSFGIALFDAKTGAKVSELPGRYDIPHGFEGISLWHPTLPVVAIDVSDGRRFGHIEVFSLVDGKIHKLSLPDYAVNALGRVNATRTANTCFSKISKWNRNDLQLKLIFNAYKEGSDNFQDFYSCEVTLGLDDTATFLNLISITPPKEP